MHERTQRVWDRLGLEVIIKAGEILPAFRSPQLDQPRPEIEAEQEPTQQPDEWQRGFPFWEWPPIQQRHHEHREETDFTDLYLPTETIKQLPNIDVGEIQEPQDEQDDGIGKPEQDQQGPGGTYPGKHDKQRI
jgi:hypothetical protein